MEKDLPKEVDGFIIWEDDVEVECTGDDFRLIKTYRSEACGLIKWEIMGVTEVGGKIITYTKKLIQE